jgi:Uncharacterized protein conserved in bacteria (DUF2252)
VPPQSTYDGERRHISNRGRTPAMTLNERRTFGAEWRDRVPLRAHAEWQPPANRPDSVDILIEQGKSRILELVPVLYARMKADALAFLRGAAAIMAYDLASGPVTGLRLQFAEIATSPISAPMRHRREPQSSTSMISTRRSQRPSSGM